MRKTVLAATILALVFVGPSSASIPSYAKSPKLIKMLPHIKERGQLAPRPVSEH